jgi:hypothetical protein
MRERSRILANNNGSGAFARVLLQVSIEFFCLSITVVQFLFTNRLKARVIIYAYNQQ